MAIEGRVDEVPGNIYVPYIRNLEHIASRNRPQVESLTELSNEWHYGPTGTGKSRAVREKYPDAYIKSAATEWWNGYNDHEVVIIEDIDIYHVKLGYHLKIWSDHYPFPANIKGTAESLIRPKSIIITSNYAPNQIWSDPQTLEPILRRFKVMEYKRIGELGIEGDLLAVKFDGDNYITIEEKK